MTPTQVMGAVTVAASLLFLLIAVTCCITAGRADRKARR